MLREWKTEWVKVRRRHIGLILCAFFGVTVLWTTWGMGQMSKEQLWDGYRNSILDFAMINTVLLPTMTAMLASRLCDAEVKGDTLKLLCTMEKKGRLFDYKLLMGSVYLALFAAAQCVLILFVGRHFGFVRPLEPAHLLYFVLEIYVPSLLILVFQTTFSLLWENQIFPLAAGIFGSFAGLFSWFFPERHLLVGAVLWGFYPSLCFINISWDEATRVQEFYDVPFPTAVFVLLLVLLCAGFLIGKRLFLRKEI